MLAFLLFAGSLISPTDPIAVLGILKTSRVSKSLSTKIAGESLFNDDSGNTNTLALVLRGYTLALSINTSGPLAIVFAGLLIGNYGRTFAMSEKTRTNLDTFWELVDEILDAVLFVLIGLEVLIITLTDRSLLAGVLANLNTIRECRNSDKPH